jgi:hypothetical protein
MFTLYCIILKQRFEKDVLKKLNLTALQRFNIHHTILTSNAANGKVRKIQKLK